MHDQIVVDVVGATSLHRGGRTLSGNQLGGRRGRLLLVSLAFARAPLPAAHLASVIWPDDLPSTWAAALRGLVRALRQAAQDLGAAPDEFITTTGAGYRLARTVDIPLVRLGTVVASALETLRSDPQCALAELDAFDAELHADELDVLADLNPAALLPGESADWVEHIRAQLAQWRTDAIMVRARASLALGQADAAVLLARQWLAAAPLEETAHQIVISAHLAAGDRSAALTAYETCRNLLAEELGIAPGVKTTELYLQALDEPTATVASIPRHDTAFVGRDDELAVLAPMLCQPGLVTITGPGGVGKSRLVEQAVRRTQAGSGGRYWVDLSTTGEDDVVAATVASALGLRLGASEPATAIAHHLAPLGPVLLILDGCEPVLDGAAALVTQLLAICDKLTVVVTSRSPLGLPGETRQAVYPWPSVDVGDPDTADRAVAGQGAAEPVTALRAPALELLYDRTASHGRALPTDPHSVALLTELVALSAGLPLALELIAVPLTEASLPDVLDELRLAFSADPQAGPHTGSATERLQQMIATSLAALSDDEQTLLRRMSVLPGPSSLAMVRDVAGYEPVSPVRVPRLLAVLQARALLRVDVSGPRWSYTVEDDVARVAGAALVEAGEHADAYYRLAEHLRGVLPTDPRTTTSYDQAITAVLPAVRALLRWSIEGVGVDERKRMVGLELAFRMHRYWATTGIAEGLLWLRRLLEAGSSGADGECVPHNWEPYALFAYGYLNYWAGHNTEAITQLAAAAATLPEAGRAYRARALIFLAGIYDDTDEAQRAVDAIYEAVLAVPEEQADLRISAVMGIACVLAERADPAAAQHAVAAIDLCRDTASSDQLAATLPTAAMVCWQVGAIEQARAYVCEALPMHEGQRRIATVVLHSAAAGVAMASGDWAAALAYAERADKDATELGVDRELPLVRALLTAARLAAARLAVGASTDVSRADVSRADVSGADLAQAAASARLCLSAARELDYGHPTALGVEAAALVLTAAVRADVTHGGDMSEQAPITVAIARAWAHAARIRANGQRPGAPSWQALLSDSRDALADRPEAQVSAELVTPTELEADIATLMQFLTDLETVKNEVSAGI